VSGPSSVGSRKASCRCLFTLAEACGFIESAVKKLAEIHEEIEANAAWVEEERARAVQEYQKQREARDPTDRGGVDDEVDRLIDELNN
jgi:hypothetical protein